MERLSVQDLAMFIGCEIECMADFKFNYNRSSGTNHLHAFPGYYKKKGDRLILDAQILSEIDLCKNEAKPILRPLSDMTEEEAYEVCELTDFWNPGVAEEYKIRKIWLIKKSEHQVRFKAHALKFLISKHFDVFGWIEKELAIDKTKL